MPWSTASFARKGGTSAVNVATRSETIASVVRALYGEVRRASVVTRRTVRAQDQSSTLASRWRIRWEPGCQTLIGVSAGVGATVGARGAAGARDDLGAGGARRASGARRARARHPPPTLRVGQAG